MTYDQFDTQTRDQQRKLLLHEGTYLSYRKCDQYSAFLYQVNNFYVEVFFKVNNLEITYVHSFEDTDHLEPYLDKINLEDLMPVS